jgi:hypothetical protein
MIANASSESESHPKPAARQLRPAAPPTPGVKREWVPSCMLMIHNEHTRTCLRFTPLQQSRDESVTYKAGFKIFDGDPLSPAFEIESPALPLFSVYSLESERVARELGRGSFFLYAEEHHRVVERGPLNVLIGLGTHMHFSSPHGGVFGHVASAFIFGAPRKMLKGDFYYENFPGVRLDADHRLIIYTMNPFTRACQYNVLMVDAKGRAYDSGMMEIPGKSVKEWSTDSMSISRPRNPFGVIIRSNLKTNSIYATIGRGNRMVSMDHGHPFLSQVLDHT